MEITSPYLNIELLFTTSRSSGKGGQHVNKTESRVSLFFHVTNSTLLSDKQKETILQSPHYNGTKEGKLQIDVETSRSQQKNKQEAIHKFYQLINRLLFIPKKRKPSKPSKAAIRKRLRKKKILSEKKQNRRKQF